MDCFNKAKGFQMPCYLLIEEEEEKWIHALLKGVCAEWMQRTTFDFYSK